ncbi:methyl-accepting chemotaxis protein [Roseibium sp.]|uniref:methyl-accepting chemotaxis protein n=1 Tax=Roseibium sp. TaxID=1936156 RepID=UPI003D130590
MKFLADLPIAARVGGLSAIAIVSIGVLLGASLYSQNVVSTEIDNLADYSEIDFKVSEVRTHAQNMRRSQKDFLLTKDPAFVEEYHSEFQLATTSLDGVEAKPQAESIKGNVQALRGVLEQHKSGFEVLSADQTEMGLDEKSGLQGALRAAVHDVEDRLKKANLDSLTVKMLMMRRHEKDFMLRGDAKYIGRIDERRKEFAELLKASGLGAADQAEIKALLDTYQTAFGNYAGKAQDIQNELQQLEETYAKIAPDWSAMSQAAHAGKLAAEAALASAQSFARTVFLIVSALALALAVSLGWLIGRSITQPVKSLTETMRTLADGTIDIEVGFTDRKSEIGSMARAVEVFRTNAIRTRELEAEQREQEIRAEEEKRRTMNELADGFESSVGAIVQAVSASSTQLEGSANTMSATAEKTQHQSATVAAAAEQASANVQTVASAAEELSSTVSEISRQVAQSSDVAETASREAKRTNEQVQGLAEAASRIGEVVSLISDIAEQTNLLALNATIEAARAGEAGRGFAVVAAEVKELASQTTKATEEISQQISSVQGATQDAVSAIDSITKTIFEINEIAGGIAAAVEEQGAATAEIARNVQEASTGTQDVTHNISGVSQAATESGRAAEELQSASGILAGNARDLKTEVDSFLARVRSA